MYNRTIPDPKTINEENWHINANDVSPDLLIYVVNKSKLSSNFQSAFNKNTFIISHKVSCKSSCVIYLMEYRLCKKSQYVGKFEYSLNLRTNTHRNDVWRIDGSPCEKDFQMPGHNFNAHAKFSIIEEVYNKSLSKLKIRSPLEDGEDFSILKLKTLSSQGLNISLNYPQGTTRSIWKPS